MRSKVTSNFPPSFNTERVFVSVVRWSSARLITVCSSATSLHGMCVDQKAFDRSAFVCVGCLRSASGALKREPVLNWTEQVTLCPRNSNRTGYTLTSHANVKSATAAPAPLLSRATFYCSIKTELSVGGKFKISSSFSTSGNILNSTGHWNSSIGLYKL